MNYILVVDDENELCEIYELFLRKAFPLDVVQASSGNHALEIIKTRGKPEVIISDLRMPDGDGYYLYSKLKETNWNIPFILSSADADTVRDQFPGIHGFIEKPHIVEPAILLVDAIVSKYKVSPTYVPIRISHLLRSGTVSFDLYIKISDQKFIKVVNAGEAFVESDAKRFKNKSLDHLLISAGDVDSYLKIFEKNLAALLLAEESPAGMAITSLETLETVERIASSLGWTPEVIEVAKKAMHFAVKTIRAEPNLLKLLDKKLGDTSSVYSRHVSMLALLSCGLCQHLGWVSDSTQIKLGLAALMHDITVDENRYEDITVWDLAASDLNDKSPEVHEYRNHPIEAANLLLCMKGLPADVDQIILQHHEMKDGTGFPRRLTSSRISPMATVFIIVQDLINFLENSEQFEEKISLFIKHRETKYNSGNFKKIFDIIKESVLKARTKS